MLCRALLAAAVFTYVLCVLLLSGVQKEDIDASTLRKLQRHNVNIDDINDQELKKQCLVKTDIPVTLTTPLTNPTTEKIEITATGRNGLPAEDTTPLQKIFEYLEFLHKEEKRKALESKDNTKKFKMGQEPFAFFSSPPFRDRIQGINDEDPTTKTPLTKTTTSPNKNDEKNKMEKNINSDLETLMNVLRTNIGRSPDSSQQVSTTVKTVKDLPVSEHTKDIGYITKIVEEIMSKRQFKEVNTAKGPNLNTNETQNVDQMFDALSKNKSISLINYYLNNCKLGNFYTNNQGDKDKLDIFDIVKRLRSSINEPEARKNDEYLICNRLKAPEQKVAPGQNDNPIISNILSELRKESQRFKLLGKESAIASIMEQQSQTALNNQKNNDVQIINANKERLNLVNKESIRALGNQSKSSNFDGLRDHMKISDALIKGGLEVSDTENDKALKIVLQSQSKLFNQIFNQQRNLIKMCNTDKEKLKPHENEITKPLQSANKAQSNNEVLSDQNDPMVTIQQAEDYPPNINENLHKSKLAQDQAKTTGHSPSFHYRPSKSDNVFNEEYKRWLLMAPNSFIIEDQATQPKHDVRTRNRMDSKLKTINTLNSIDLDPNFVKEYKRPWFYAELGNKHFKLKTNGNQQGLLFKPNSDTKITNTVEPRLKSSYEKSWSPYFDTADNNTAVIRTNENIRANKKQPILISAYPTLIQSNVRGLTDNSKKYPMIDGTYANKYPSVIEDRSSDQLETNKDNTINKFNCQTIHETRVECLSAAEYKSNWVHFKNKQNIIQKSDKRANNEEIETFNNNIGREQNNYRFPSRPTITRQHLDSDTPLDRFNTNINDDDILSQNETKDSKKTPSFPPNVIKDLAQSIKDFVLRDLKTTTMTITPSSTPTSQTATTIPTTITTTVTSATTEEEMPTTSNKDPLKIQDASKTLEKMMEMLAKISLMKGTVLESENVKHVPYNMNTTVTTQKSITQCHEQLIVPKDTILQHQKNNKLEENRVQHDPHPLNYNVEDPKPYIPRLEEIKVEDMLPYGSQPLQRNPENHVSYVTQVQHNPENRLAYDSQTLNLSPNHRVLYDTQPLQQVNRVPCETQTPKPNLKNPEISEPYVSQAVQTGLRLYPHSLERSPGNGVYVPQAPVNQSPYVPKFMQLKIENPTYVPQAVHMKTDGRFPFDSQMLQSNQENPQHDTQSLQRNPGDSISVPDAKTESRLRYFPLALQPKTENRVPYELQPNPEISVTYLPTPFQYLPHSAELPPGPYGSRVVQPVKTENYLPYNPKPLLNGPRNRPYDYSMMDPYHHSKIEYNTHLKEARAPYPQKKVKTSSGKEVITVQTNSGEISPLKIVLQKPFVQNIVLTTQAPVKVHHSEETLNFRKPIQKQNRHQVEIKESDMSNINEDNGYTPRHTHKDSKIAALKPRKTKREREVIQHYKPRDLNEIEKFHEKLERGDANWQHKDEKIAKRVQRPIVKNTNYDDTHFRNFLQTQQKVNAMLEKILAAGKTKPISAEVI